MNCPKCDVPIAQSNTAECPSCGVVLAKASSRPFQRSTYARPQARPPAAEASGIPWSKVIRIGIVVVAIWYGWQFITGKKAAASSWYQGADGYERAVAEQKSTSQPIVLYFYTEWCGYCKQLDREVLSTAKFGTTYPSVIKVKVNPEKDGRAASALAERYEIRGFPTIFVVPSKGRTASIVGYGDSDRFYARLTEAVTR
jgi:thiol:disulfide interchange protein